MSSDSSYMEDSEHVVPSPNQDAASSPPPAAWTTHGQPNATLSPAQLISEQVLVSRISTDPYAQGQDGETYFRRPNRYFGPASTWLSWTKEERTAAQSLERMQSQDLSAHLFNAYSLKRKAETLGRGEAKRRRNGKEGAGSVSTTKVEDDDSEEQARGEKRKIGLPRSWTAWPMPPGQVPREELLPQMHPEGLRCYTVDDPPSADLEAWIIATATKIARETWTSRECESEDEVSSTTEEDNLVHHGEAVKPINTMEYQPMEDDQDEEQSQDQDVSSPAQHDEAEVFFSQPANIYDDDNGSQKMTDAEADDDSTEQERAPVPLADDDKARQIFRPSARHILSKLDGLLLGLHKTRHAYASKPPGRPRGRHSQSQTPERSYSRGRSRSRAASRRVIRTSSEESEVSNHSSRSGQRPRRVDKLGLGDWSDVVGMASLTGWDPAVVERASKRCAELFGENMLFRTFHENNVKEEAEARSVEHFAVDTSSEALPHERDNSEPEQETILVIRTSRPCTACRTARLPCRPPDDQVGNPRMCKECVEAGADCSGVRVEQHADTRVCPHELCPRHTIPFRSRYHLQRHLDSVHEADALTTSRSGSRARATSTARSDIYTSDLSQQVGSSPPRKHDIVCPVKTCRRHVQPFSKGKKLYEHVRTMHPDLDVGHVKRDQARRRSESRRRWPRTRSQAGRSQGAAQTRSQGQSRTRKTDDVQDVAMESGEDEIEDAKTDVHAEEEESDGSEAESHGEQDHGDGEDQA